MPARSKLALSTPELTALRERRFFTLKHRVSQKLVIYLNSTRDQLALTLQQLDITLPPGTDTTYGKISRGENYQGFPYFILDYPRLFHNDGMFAFRTMIWWGHYCSFSLLLKGPEKQTAARRLIARQPPWPATDFICIHPNAWQHHFGSDNVRPLAGCTPAYLKQLMQRRDFLKVMRRWPLSRAEQLPQAAARTFAHFAGRLLL